MLDDLPGRIRSGAGDSAGETATIVLPATIVSVGALVNVAFDGFAPSITLLFLPDDFRRLGVEPRPGNHWLLHLSVDFAGQTVETIRLVGIAAP